MVIYRTVYKGIYYIHIYIYTKSSVYSSISFSDMPIDPNEPRYCYCKSVSYGEMVACDNEEVKTGEKKI